MYTKLDNLSKYSFSNGGKLVLLIFSSLLISVCTLTPDRPPVEETATNPPNEKASSAETISPVGEAPQSVVIPSSSFGSSENETSGTEEVLITFTPVYSFDEQDCSCASFPGELKARTGPGYLKCNFSWSGTYIDDNQASLVIEHYNDPDELQRVFEERLGWEHDSIETQMKLIDTESLPDDELYFSRNDSSGVSYVNTGPGGGSSKTGSEIPMCGSGGGIIQVERKYLIVLRLFACDLGDTSDVYITAIQTLENCTLDNIKKAMAAIP